MSHAVPSVRAQIVEARTYLRPIDDRGTIFETSEQAVDRLIGHQRWLWERAKGQMQSSVGLSVQEEAELSELRMLLLDRRANASGRTRWLGGTELSRRIESTMFNCSYCDVRTVHDVVDVLWLLLQGCGVGFRPVVGALNGFANRMKIEVVRSQRGPRDRGPEHNVETFEDGVWTIKIGDSAAAWAKSAGKLMAGKHHAQILRLDFSQIRGAGARLRAYGWISSGDSQIARAYVAIAEIMNKRAGQLLTRMDILDVVNWLGTILSSRRSAEIALFEYDQPEWEDFVSAKKEHTDWIKGDKTAPFPNPQRAMANNSLVFNKRPTKYALNRLFKQMVDNGGSEPGLFNAGAAMRRAPWFRGTNPCVPGGTRILTRSGYRPISALVGAPTEIWNGKDWSTVTPFSTGVNALVDVILSDGTSLRCTRNHVWLTKPTYCAPEVRVAAEHLIVGTRLSKYVMPVIDSGEAMSLDAYSQGFYQGDGNTGLQHSWVYEPKFTVVPRLCGSVSETVRHGRVYWRHGQMLEKNFVPHDASLSDRIDWLAGLLDADGCVVRDENGNGLQLTSIDRAFLIETRLMLTTLGIRAKVCNGHPQGHVFDGYECRACYRLLIPSTDVLHLVNLGIQFSRLVVHGNKPQRDARRFVTVIDVVPVDEDEETFCFTDTLNHSGTFEGIVTGQCGEILLGHNGFCNLAETVLHRFNGDIDALHRAHHLIARANYRQTCVDLRDGVLQEGWHQLNEFLRLCGVGVTGVVAWEHSKDADAWRDLRKVAIDGANSMADELGLPRSKCVTTLKPSGTQSKASGIEGLECPEGIHKPLGRFIFNNIRFSAHDPIVAKLRAANYHIFGDDSDASAAIVRVPVEYGHIEFDKVETPNGTVEVNKESAIDQLERYKLLMDNYVDHNASITVSYDPDEVPDIVDWLMANWDSYVGVSFLFRNDPSKTAEDLGYAYLPQEVVNEATYRAYVGGLKSVNLTDSASLEMLQDEECAGGACPIR